MNTTTALNSAADVLAPFTHNTATPQPFRLDVWVKPERFLEAATALYEQNWGYLCAITGIDRPAKTGTGEEDHIEVLYHFAEGAAVVTLRVLLPYRRLVISSICHLVSSASMYERELMELLGVLVEGTPNSDKLILPDEWPAGVYPLRKSFKGLHSLRDEEA